MGGVAGVALAWAVAWAPVAVLIGLMLDPDGSMDEPWAAIGAYPGFIAGVLFSAVLAIAVGHRRWDEMPLGRAALCGAVAGLLVGALPLLISEPTTAVPMWQLGGGFMGATTLMSAVSAVGTVTWLRSAARRRSLAHPHARA
jgi:hypothetical protein